MGLVESRQPPARRDHIFQRSSSASGFWGRLYRSRCARLVLSKKINCQLMYVVGVFFVIFLVQILLLPGAERDGEKGFGGIHGLFRKHDERSDQDLSFLKELDYGEDVKFEPLKILAKFQRDVNDSALFKNVTRFGYIKPKLALIFADLRVDPHQILMVTVASALREIGYEIEVFSLEDGPVNGVWREVGLPLNVITADENMKFSVDWLNYHGIVVNSLRAAGVVSSLMQEPFRNVPLVWTIHEQALAARLRQYVSSGRTEMVDSWRKVFQRASVVIFPDYTLPVVYSSCDAGNYFVIPGSPAGGWAAKKLTPSYKDFLRTRIHRSQDHFSIVIVGSQLMYRGFWLDHALILQAMYPVLTSFHGSSSHLQISVLSGDNSSNHSRAVERIALNLKYPNETVKHVAVDENADSVINAADLVIYASLLEEYTFPGILLKAMCFGKPVVAPDLPMTRKYVSNRVNGFLFPKDNIRSLSGITSQLVSNGKLSAIAGYAASIAKRTAKDLMVSESVEGYADLLENILKLPSEVAAPRAAREIPTEHKTKWLWQHFEPIRDAPSPNNTQMIHKSLDSLEKQFYHTHKESSPASSPTNYSMLLGIWEEQSHADAVSRRKRIEEDELRERSDQPRRTWDEVYRNARRVDHTLHERDEGELVRTGQPLCIYEPYYGEGTWPFLHHTSLYRGLGLSRIGRRPGADDVDASARLSLLKNGYYRDLLGEHGAFFAVANRVDRLHKNAWIGFQSWRATARLKSLSKNAERLLLEAIEARTHGDTLYFWSRLDSDSRFRPEQDFWSFCDAVNAGNCRFAFSEAMKEMYGIEHEHDMNLLPQMPLDGGTWSVMHCWAAPTRSFLEFVMFSRMFVDALDAEFNELQEKGNCPLSLSKDKHCYSRLLELLINVWAYHSARRMVYIDPETGSMREQHELSGRRGRMWVKWFQFSMLKSMDEELAEEFDSGRLGDRRLWPSTGEVYWRGVYEKERTQRIKAKERKKQLSRQKIERMRRRNQQKALGKYVKPVEESNTTTTNPL